MKEILLKAQGLARLVLADALREIEHQAKNGLDRERLQRASAVAISANDLLSAEVRPPRTEPTPRQTRRAAYSTKPPEPVRRGRGGRKRDPNGLTSRAAGLIVAAGGDYVTSSKIAEALGIPARHVAGVVSRAKVVEPRIRGRRGKGYRVRG